MVFHLGLSNNKSPWIFRTSLSILADLKSMDGLYSPLSQSTGAVEYTDCTSAEG